MSELAATSDSNLKKCSNCKELKNKACFGKRKKSTDGLDYSCKQCESKYWKEYYQKNSKKLSLNKQIWYEENVEQIKEQQRNYRKANPEKILAKNARRILQLKQATPKWLTDEQIKQMNSLYFKAKDLQRKTGRKYHVDHIVPLTGKTVSGLNVPWNLQIVTQKQNLKKANNLE